MPLIRLSLFTLALACASIGTTHAAASPTPTVNEQELRKMLVERVDAQKWATGVVVGVLSPQGRHVVAYGTMGLSDKRAVNGDTVFEIASLTKIFTALLLADMAREGKVKVNAPVSTCLPGTVKVPQHNDRQITFVDLATHTSGLPLRPTNLASQLALNKYAGYTQEQLYRGLADFTLTRDAGSKFEYSNWGFGLLANALAYCAGQSYETLLRDRVTQPLGMEDTRLDPTPSMRARLASGYDGNLKPVGNEGRGALDGAGGLYSTVDDLLKFVALFLGQGPPSLAAAPATMLEPRRPGDDPHTQMALGWRVSTANGKQSVWSAGRADGYRSYMAFDPQTQIAVVALANAATNGGVDDIGRHVLDPTVQVAKAHKWITVAAPVLDRYLGRYRFDDDGTFVTVTRNGTQLIVEMSGQGPLEVFPTGLREFFPKDIEAQFLFADPGVSASASVVLSQDGQSYLGKRVADAPVQGEKP